MERNGTRVIGISVFERSWESPKEVRKSSFPPFLEKYIFFQNDVPNINPCGLPDPPVRWARQVGEATEPWRAK